MFPKFSSFAFLFLISLSYRSLEARSTLSRGSSLSVEDASDLLTSPDNTFACGFYHVAGANAYWFSIWFTKSIEKTVVWMANRDNPVNGRGSRLMLHHNGVMVLTDVDGSTAWQVYNSSTNVNTAELLNSGNLVLKDPRGKILWQSFDYPTDTLLPNQIFTKDTKLTSRRGKQMFASGYFSLVFDNDNVLKLIYNGPDMANEYWPDPDFSVYDNGRTNYNSSTVAVLDDAGRFLSSDELKFRAVDMGLGIKRRLTLDYDGNFRLYSLNHLSGHWIVMWEAVRPLCNVHGLCGRIGICVHDLEPRCSCPPYYEPVDSTDWTKGCKPKFERSCFDSQFIELPHVDYYGFDLDYIKPISFENCKQHCLNNCQCKAFSYRLTGLGQCWLKGDLFNGYRSPDFPGSVYIRLPKDVQPSENATLKVSELACGSGKPKTVINHSPYDITSERSQWVYWYSIASTIGALEILILVMVSWFLFRKNEGSSAAGYLAILSQFRSFGYGELKAATGKFKEVLGRGSFGVVYKGVLADGRVVDVYSYGVVLLELVMGIRLSNRTADNVEEAELNRFARMARRKMGNGEHLWFKDIVDPRLEGNFNWNQAAVMIKIGLSCVEEDRNKRPTMESIAQILLDCQEEIDN
ncbi:hypothetical protein Ancab_032116 [Ancistrocladus abbreviatus]